MRQLESDLAPARLSMRLSSTQALQEAGAIAVVLPAHGYVDDTSSAQHAERRPGPPCRAPVPAPPPRP